jgi:hypothetical protein
MSRLSAAADWAVSEGPGFKSQLGNRLPRLRSSAIFSVLPGQFRDIISKLSMIASFQILPHSFLTIRISIRHYVV